MTARIRKFISDLEGTFWLVPGLMVLAAILAALALVRLDRTDIVPQWLLKGWLYDGGGTGARTLLGVVAASTIGVAGTVFSITIAALTLAAGQMGPRLLRNFTHDRGVQFTLGAFLGTFSYALIVLRSVRTQSEGAFVPHLSLSVGILFAFVCVATLVYFVGHMAGRINVDTVVELVSGDVRSAIERLTSDARPSKSAPAGFWRDATPVVDSRRGYLQQLDDDGLADWAAEHEVAIQLLVGRGDYVFPGAPIAVVKPPAKEVDAAIRNAMALSPQRGSADLEFVVRQLVEVAVRALSPGINDPYTAMSVLDRLGTALCDVVPLQLPNGILWRDDRLALVVPSTTYDGLVDAMFHMIRQNAAGNTAVLMRMIEVLTAVASCERNSERLKALERHAGLVLGDAERNIATPEDLAAIRKRHAFFVAMANEGPRAYIGSDRGEHFGRGSEP